MPPPPPRRSVKPSGPPPPPPRPPRGQRLAGIFSTPPPPPVRTEPPAARAATPAVAEPLASEAPVTSAPDTLLEAAPAAAPVLDSSPTPIAEEAPRVAETPVVVPSPIATAESSLQGMTPLEPSTEAPAPLDAPAPTVAVEAPLTVAAAPSSPALPPLPASRSSRPPPLPASVSLPAPASTPAPTSAMARVAAAQARLVSAVPPAWIEVARAWPVLWMVALPVGVASLLILTLVALEPPASAKAEPAVATNAAAPERAPSIAAGAAPAEKQADGPTLAELEAKPSGSLGIDELMRLTASRAEQKRSDVRSLSLKLQKEPSLAQDAAVQAELLRLAADPATADAALAAMAHTRSSIGADLLHEVWTSRSLPPATAELARSLLFSRDVRPNASPALAAALDLRGAESCEAVRASLPNVISHGDRRALSALAKLNARGGCGPKKDEDCYACLRAQMKPVVTAIAKVKGRRPPSYPVAPKP
jgi:hypothetical protein